MTPKERVDSFVAELPVDNTIEENAALILQFIEDNNFTVICTLPRAEDLD